MAWKVGALLLVVVSVVGAVVRVRAGDYLYLSASLFGLGIAMWLWKRARRPRPTPKQRPTDDRSGRCQYGMAWGSSTPGRLRMAARRVGVVTGPNPWAHAAPAVDQKACC